MPDPPGRLHPISATVVRVLSTAHDIADARLHRIVRSLLARPHTRVLVEAPGLPQNGPPGATVTCTTTRRTWQQRLLRAIVSPWRGTEDVLLVVDPELVLPAWLSARLRRRRLVVDLHEDYRAVAQDRPWTVGPIRILAKAAVAVMLRAAARADLTVIADDHVPPIQARRRLVVQNVPAAGELGDAGEPGPTPRAIYIGDLRPSRGLYLMLDAIDAAPAWHLDLVGEVREVSMAGLQDTLLKQGLADRVHLHGRLPLDRAWKLAAGAWAGLCLLGRTPAYEASMPTKVLEYLSVGLPVLATPLPRVRALIMEEARAGRCVATASEAGTTLQAWSDDPRVPTQFRVAARAWAGQHLAATTPFDDLAAAILTLRQEPAHP